MNGREQTARRKAALTGSVVLTVVLLPWIGTLWPERSVFGFPLPAFLLLLLGPALLIAVAGMSPEVTTQDGDDAP